MGSYAFYAILPIVLLLMVYSSKNNRTSMIIFFMLFFFSIFRGDKVGNDTMNYMDPSTFDSRLNNINILSDSEFLDIGSSFEISTNMLYYFVQALDLPARTIISLFSIITFLFLLLAIKRFRVPSGLALFYFVLFSHYYYSYSAARQIASVCILLYAYSFLIEDNKKKYLFMPWTIVAGSIHISSLLFIPLICLKNIKVSRKRTILIIYLLSLFFAFSNGAIVENLLNKLDLYYIVHHMDTYGEVSTTNIVGKTFIFVKLTTLTIFFYYIRGKNKYTDIYDNLFLISILFYFLFMGLSTYISRISYGLTIFNCIYLAKFLDIKTERNALLRLNYLIFCVFFLYDTIYLGYHALSHGYYLNI